MNIYFPENTPIIIDAIRSGIGRDVEFVHSNKTPCSACSIDPTTDTSTNSFCIVCSGVGYTYTYSGVHMLAHVTHAPSEFMRWSVAGQYPEGDVRVQVGYTPEALIIIKNADYAIVDGEKFDVRKILLRGVKQLNRILVDLIQRV